METCCDEFTSPDPEVTEFESRKAFMTKEKSSRIECASVRVTKLVVFTFDPAGSAPTDHPLCVIDHQSFNCGQ